MNPHPPTPLSTRALGCRAAPTPLSAHLSIQPLTVGFRVLPQVDLNMEPFRRKEMTKYNDGVTALPQLRVNGVFVGGGDAVQAGLLRAS